MLLPQICIFNIVSFYFSFIYLGETPNKSWEDLRSFKLVLFITVQKNPTGQTAQNEGLRMSKRFLVLKASRDTSSTAQGLPGLTHQFWDQIWVGWLHLYTHHTPMPHNNTLNIYFPVNRTYTRHENKLNNTTSNLINQSVRHSSRQLSLCQSRNAMGER